MAELNDPSLWSPRFPWPDAVTHNHSRGRLGVVSGGPLSTGAASVEHGGSPAGGAGRAAGRRGLGQGAASGGALEAVMVEAFASPDALEAMAEAMDSVVIGPAAGLNDATVQNLAALARTGAALVVDADALTIFKGRGVDLFASLDRDDVLTPHEGEFERIFPGLLSQGREAAAQEAAARAGAHIVLKGAETVIASPEGRLRINRNGSPWLATAGSGDVLAGLIGGLIAQHMDSFDAACAAVWIHGAAGERFGPGLIAEDLPDLIPAVLRELRG